MQESGEWEVGGGEMCSRDLAGHPEVWQWRCAGGESQRAGPLRLLQMAELIPKVRCLE